MGGGPRAIGCSTATCSRVVLDANCFRASPRREIERVAARGFSISVSVEALREVWGRALRENDTKLINDRAQVLAPHLDTETPIAFVAAALAGTIGTIPSGLRKGSAEFRDQVTTGWHALVAGNLTDSGWREIGEALDQELTEEEVFWDGMLGRVAGLERDVRTFKEKHPDFEYPRSRAMAVMLRGLQDGIPASTTPRFAERADALFRYLATKLSNVIAQKPAKNDYHDARHLYHLAWPAFLMTADRKLIESVDASGTVQAQWVRTPVELVEEQVCRAPPWGKPARAVARAFERDTGALFARLPAWRQSLR